MAFRNFIAITAILSGLGGGNAVAQSEDPPPFKSFDAKRVTVPGNRSGPRINVQIDPAAQSAAIAPVAEAPATATAPAPTAAWFWDVVSPALTAQSPGRLEEALAALVGTEAQSALSPPRLDDMRAITDAFGTDILLATIGTQVSPALVAAVISVESSGRTDAESSAGATGLMQLIPATATRFGVEDATDPAQNIKGGVAYLDWLLTEFDLDPVLALAAYNAGENAVKLNGGVPDYAETRGYVPKVLAAWQVASGLCQTPPLLVTDGCAFIRTDN